MTIKSTNTLVKMNIEKEIEHYLTEPKHVRIIKKLAILFSITIIIYLVTLNFFVDKEFNYHYNIGSQENHLSPLTRISEAKTINNTTYKELTHNLVYFNVDIPKNSKTITIRTRLKPSSYENEKISLGAKDQEYWHYKYNLIYNKNINLTNYNYLDNIYTKNEPITQEQLKNKKNIVIATDQEISLIPNIILNYKNTTTTINTTLRGKHDFYFYTEEPLKLEVKKQDINWYNNSDELTISVYDINNNQIINTTIPDDGITTVNKEPAIIQSTNLTKKLNPGIYKLSFSNFDGLIKEIKINTNKIVAKKLFLADNNIYQNQTIIPTTIYTQSKNIKLLTYHKAGLQNITYNNKTFNFNIEDEKIDLHLDGETNLTFPKNDIIIEATSYLSFNKENYFEPFTQTITSLDNYKQADYILTTYKQPIKDNGWIITETTFNLDNLYIKNNKLSLVFNIPHLGKEEYKNYTIPVDYINITISKPSIFRK